MGGRASDMKPFVVSTDLVDDPPALRERFARDGYVFLPGVVDPERVAEVRRDITEVCASHGWFRPGTDPLDAVPGVPPTVEGESRYFEVYDDIQRLESFHSLSHDESVARCMRALLGDSAFPHPLSIARLVFPANDEWTTPPHQDYPNNQGTEDLYACWIPLSDVPAELGGLSVLAGSHQRGLAPLEYSLGPGNRQAVVDERFDGLEWVGGEFRAGDAIVFHSLTLHRALPNRSERMRLSVDYRFQREGEPLTEGCLEPHFGRLSWDEIYRGWSRPELQYYWRDKQYEVVPWDATLHEIPAESLPYAFKTWFTWQQKVIANGGVVETPEEFEHFRRELAKALADERRSSRVT